MKVICVSGCVGTGKTTLSKKLIKGLHYDLIDISKLIKEKNLSLKYDKEKQCEVIDVKKLNKYLIETIKKSKKGIVIDSHLSHYLPKKYVDLCIVTTCDISTLRDRLKKRKYSLDKIKENVEAEIFDVCIIETKERKHNLMILDTTKGYNIQEIIKFIREMN